MAAWRWTGERWRKTVTAKGSGVVGASTAWPEVSLVSGSIARNTGQSL
jgi:hypothetical protein